MLILFLIGVGIIIIADRFCIALFLAQTHCAHVTLNELLYFLSLLCVCVCIFLNIHQNGVLIAIWLLHGWCHMKLLPPQRILCTPYNHAQIYSATDTKLRASTES